MGACRMRTAALGRAVGASFSYTTPRHSTDRRHLDHASVACSTRTIGHASADAQQHHRARSTGARPTPLVDPHTFAVNRECSQMQ